MHFEDGWVEAFADQIKSDPWRTSYNMDGREAKSKPCCDLVTTKHQQVAEDMRPCQKSATEPSLAG
jgi:hypothetical protein